MSTATAPLFSYEFFPPRSAEMECRLWRAMGQLERLARGFRAAGIRRIVALRGDPQAGYRLSVEPATQLWERLLREGVEHLHFYTLNQADMCLDISLALGASINPNRVSSAA
jgi:5,10-methylenetetrahydrofolate reductase